MKTFCYLLPKGIMVLEIDAENLTEAKRKLRKKYGLKRINFEVWEQFFR